MTYLHEAIDVHLHTAPDVVARRYTDVEAAHRARSAGMRAIVLKCHHESTVGRAAAASAITGVGVYGGLVLNRHTSGGIDPLAVLAALELGARIVWMPTVTSDAHHAYYNGLEVVEEPLDPSAVRQICREVRGHGAVLATGHLGKANVRALVGIAAEEGARLLVTHADFVIPDFDPDEQAELARSHEDLWFERCAYICAAGTPEPRPIDRLIAAIEATDGPARNVLSSDLGQPELPDYPEGLEVFAEALVRRSIPPQDVRSMLVEQPAALLGLS